MKSALKTPKKSNTLKMKSPDKFIKENFNIGLFRT